ncbi:MAG: phage/plasmid replication protein, partial [Candidatus Paceibacterota bacterium]
MFDTIQFYYDTVDKFHEQYLLEITNHSFSDKKPHWKARKLSNFWVWTSSNGRLHVRGSLAKYHLGNNIEHLSTEEIEQAVQSLCSKLMIKPEGCKLTQLDIGITFRMNHPVLHYQDCMWYCKYLPRWTKGSSIYFGKESRVLNIYDKLVEADHSGMIIPDSFQEHHLLRYECRYEGNIDERFKRSDSTLDLLYDGLFVHEAIENYVSEFNNIRMFAGLDNSSLIGTSTAEAIKHDYAR